MPVLRGMDGAQPRIERHKLGILVTASATSSLIMLDSNIVAVALPSIARELHATFDGVQWIISAYLLTFAALLLPSGSLADRFGRRRMALAGVALFLVSSAACGLATSALVLDVARAVQGIGGSLLLISALAILTNAFRGRERVAAFAWWGTSLGIAITLGPIVGGLITGFFGWRWAFLINVPLCAVFLVALRRYAPESRDPDAGSIDVGGIVTLSGGLFALIAALIDGNRLGWNSSSIELRFAAAIVLLAAFVAVERRQRRPMLDVGLFRNRALIGAAFAGFGYGASAQVLIFFLPVYLQDALGLTPDVAGVALLPFAAPLFLAPRVAASLIGDWSHRHALLLALGLTVAGDLLLGIVAPAGSYLVAAGAMLLAGIGTGLLNPETAKAMQSMMPPSRAGMASGIGATARFVSLLLGVAILGAVMARVYPHVGTVDPHAAARGFAGAAFAAAALGVVAIAGIAALLPAAPALAAAPTAVAALE